MHRRALKSQIGFYSGHATHYEVETANGLSTGHLVRLFLVARANILYLY